jgi:hypothetical protein
MTREILRAFVLATLGAVAPGADVDVEVEGRESGEWSVHFTARVDGGVKEGRLGFDPHGDSAFELARSAADVVVSKPRA